MQRVPSLQTITLDIQLETEMSQIELAEKVGCDQQLISRLVNGQTNTAGWDVSYRLLEIWRSLQPPIEDAHKNLGLREILGSLNTLRAGIDQIENTVKEAI